jgi:hypothetical protein
VLAPAILAVIALGVDARCRAGLVIEAPSVTVAPGSSGSFDVLITSTGGTFDVAGDTIELSLTGLSGVTFTGVQPQMGASSPFSYIFAVPASTQGGTFSFDTFPNTQFDVLDSEFSLLGYQAIGSGDFFGVVNVQYSVDASAMRGAMGTLAIGPDTSLSDPSGNPVAFTTQNGSITISSVPEPMGLVSAVIGMTMVGAGFFVRARRRTA